MTVIEITVLYSDKLERQATEHLYRTSSQWSRYSATRLYYIV